MTRRLKESIGHHHENPPQWDKQFMESYKLLMEAGLPPPTRPWRSRGEDDLWTSYDDSLYSIIQELLN